MTNAFAQREFRHVLVSLIDEPQLAARTEMDEQKLEELTRDIRAIGILEPLLLVQTGERYEVIAGHRRRVAAGRAGLVDVPAIVYATRDAALERVKYSENRFREELNAADEALFFSELLERDCGGDVDKLCELIGERRSYVEGRLLLFRGDERVFAALREGKIAIGIAHALNKCGDELQRRSFLHSAIVGGATVAIVAGWVSQWQQIQDQTANPGGAPAAPATMAPVPQTDFFRCYVCGGTEHVHLMQPINVHGHCRLAILDKLLDVERGNEHAAGTINDPRR